MRLLWLALFTTLLCLGLESGPGRLVIGVARVKVRSTATVEDITLEVLHGDERGHRKIGRLQTDDPVVFDFLTRDLILQRVRFRIGDSHYEEDISLHLSGGESARVEIDGGGKVVTQRVR